MTLSNVTKSLKKLVLWIDLVRMKIPKKIYKKTIVPLSLSSLMLLFVGYDFIALHFEVVEQKDLIKIDTFSVFALMSFLILGFLIFFISTAFFAITKLSPEKLDFILILFLAPTVITLLLLLPASFYSETYITKILKNNDYNICKVSKNIGGYRYSGVTITAALNNCRKEQ